MANEILKRDQNHVTVLAGITNDADQDITMLRVDPITKRLLVAATGGGGGGVSSVVAGDAIDVDSTDPANPVVSVEDDGITNAKLAEMPTLTIKGNDSGGSANPQDLTRSEVNSILKLVELVGVNTTDSSAIANTTATTDFDIDQAITSAVANSTGRAFVVIANGRLSSTGTPSMTISYKLNGTRIWDSGALAVGSGVTDRPWSMMWLMTIRASGGSGSVQVSPIVTRIDARQSNNPAEVTAVDLTLGVTLDIAATWSAASPSNTITMESLTVIDLNS